MTPQGAPKRLSSAAAWPGAGARRALMATARRPPPRAALAASRLLLRNIFPSNDTRPAGAGATGAAGSRCCRAGPRRRSRGLAREVSNSLLSGRAQRRGHAPPQLPVRAKGRGRPGASPARQRPGPAGPAPCPLRGGDSDPLPWDSPSEPLQLCCGGLPVQPGGNFAGPVLKAALN